MFYSAGTWSGRRTCPCWPSSPSTSSPSAPGTGTSSLQYALETNITIMLNQAIVAVSDLTWSASFCLIPIFLNFWGSRSAFSRIWGSASPEFEDADQLFSDLQITISSVAEPEPVEPKLFWGAGAGTGAVIIYFGSGAPEPKLSFYF